MRSLLILLMVAVVPAHAARAASMFDEGHTHFSLGLGNGYAFNQNYLVFSAGATYYLVDGLGMGFSVENWSGASPGITKFSPYVQYVFDQGQDLKPYVGGFYRQSTVSGQPNIRSVGGRAGINYMSGSNAYISFGLVYESYLDCKSTQSQDCSQSYPDVGITFGF